MTSHFNETYKLAESFQERPYLLLVDDEKQILEIVKSQLRMHPLVNDYELETAESGEEALEIANAIINEGGAIAVVVSDQIMPGMKGDSFLVELNSFSPDSKKILLTGQAELSAVARAVNFAGLYRYLAKPWEKTDLLLTIEEAGKSFNNTKYINRQNQMLEILYSAAQKFSEIISPAKLVEKLMRIVLKYTNAERGVLISYGDGALMNVRSFSNKDQWVEIEKSASELFDNLTSEALHQVAPMAVVEQVTTSGAPISVPNVKASPFRDLPYMQRRRTKSFICQPLLQGIKMIGIIYIEHNEKFYAFRPEVGMFLELLSVNAAIAYEKAADYQNLDQRVEARTREVVAQKQIIEEINQELTHSLHYARRLQISLAPSARRFQEIFTDSFILYQPKEIISGDFYWFIEKERYIYFAACDCTGHGVPGAMLSVLGGNLLGQIVRENQPLSTDAVLQKLDEAFNAALQQEDHENHSLDGMDVALCRVNKAEGKIEFSGAMRNLILLRDGKLEEIKGDRITIGGTNGETLKAFTRKELTIQKGDSVFIFTDGITDQFGQESGRKFGAKKLYEILEQNAQTPMQTLCALIQNELAAWRGKEEQTDDILIIGVRN